MARGEHEKDGPSPNRPVANADPFLVSAVLDQPRLRRIQPRPISPTRLAPSNAIEAGSGAGAVEEKKSPSSRFIAFEPPALMAIEVRPDRSLKPMNSAVFADGFGAAGPSSR